MTKTSIPAQAAEKEKLDAQRKRRLIGNAERTEIDLDDALDDSFPASDPPSMTQPETEVGAPARPEKLGKESKMQATWMPHEKHGRLTQQSDLPETVYAFPKQRKEPLTDAQHVRNAVARFDQVTGVSDADRALAFANIEKAAKHYNVDLSETSWHDLGVHPQRNREEAAKGAATRERKHQVRD